MSTLFVIGNLNTSTIEIVAKSLKEDYPEGFDTVVMFESPESEYIEYEQVKIYRKYFGAFKKETMMLKADGTVSTDMLLDVFSKSGHKVIDLSNGKKSTTAILYMAAILCRIDNIHFLQLYSVPKDNMVRGIDYSYCRMQDKIEYEGLSKIGCFDLVYYIEEVDSLFDINKTFPDEESEIGKMYSSLKKGITEFFFTDDYASVIYNTTLSNERFIAIMLAYIQENELCIEFCHENKIDVKRKDPVEVIIFFFKKYAKLGSDREIMKLCTVPGLLSALREFRNLSAHYTSHGAFFSRENARTAINMQIEAIRCVKQNRELWRMIGNE